MKRAVSLGLLFLVAESALAVGPGWNLGGNYENIRGQEFTKLYLVAAGSAFQVANLQLEKNGQPLLYCAPKSPTMTADNYVQTLERALPVLKAAYGEKFADVPLEFLLLYALKDAFPCSSN